MYVQSAFLNLNPVRSQYFGFQWKYSNGYNDCGGNAFDVRLAYHQPEQNHAVVFVHQQVCIVLPYVWASFV